MSDPPTAVGPINSPAPEPRPTFRKWLREAGVYLAAYGIPLALLFPWTGWRPDAEFLASLKTRAIAFTIADYDGAGFAGSLVNITFDDFDRLDFPLASKCSPSKAIFNNATLQSLPLPARTQVRIEWYEAAPRGVRMVIEYKDNPQPADLFLDPKSTVTIPGCSVRSFTTGRVSIYPKVNQPFTLSLDPVSPDPKKPTSLVFALDKKLSLSPHDLAFLLNGQSAIVGTDGSIQVLNADRKEPIRPQQDLVIDSLRPETHIPELRVKDDGIAVTIDGGATTVKLDGNDLRPSAAEYLKARKVLSAWLAMAVLLGSAALTVLSRIKLVKIDDKGK